MLTIKLLPAAILLSLAVGSSANAASCASKSSAVRAELIELYTSEGCSSCPPADKWLRALVPATLSAAEVVPLSFHVDYWDRLGWRDRFADPSYTARQQAYSKVSGSSFVFTPQVIVSGRNYQDWSNNSRLQKDVRSALAIAPEANIVLQQQPAASGKLEFEVQAQLLKGVSSGDVRIYAVLFQNGLVSAVAKGENSGSQLHHDYVVRALITSKATEQTGTIKIQNQFILPDDALPKAMGVAVFAQNIKTGAVLQAMSAPLCVIGK